MLNNLVAPDSGWAEAAAAAAAVAMQAPLVLRITGVPSREAMVPLLRFLYTGQVGPVGAAEIRDAILLTQRFLMKDARAQLMGVLFCAHTTDANTCEIIEWLAQHSPSPESMPQVFNKRLACFPHECMGFEDGPDGSSSTFAGLDAMSVDTINGILSESNALDINEQELYTHIVAWARRDIDARRSVITADNFALHLMSVEFLRDVVAKDGFIDAASIANAITFRLIDMTKSSKLPGCLADENPVLFHRRLFHTMFLVDAIPGRRKKYTGYQTFGPMELRLAITKDGLELELAFFCPTEGDATRYKLAMDVMLISALYVDGFACAESQHVEWTCGLANAKHTLPDFSISKLKNLKKPVIAPCGRVRVIVELESMEIVPAEQNPAT